MNLEKLNREPFKAVFLFKSNEALWDFPILHLKNTAKKELKSKIF